MYTTVGSAFWPLFGIISDYALVHFSYNVIIQIVANPLFKHMMIKVLFTLSIVFVFTTGGTSRVAHHGTL